MKTKQLPYITLSKRDMGFIECIREAYAPIRKKNGKRVLSDLQIIRGSLGAHITLLAENGMIKLEREKGSK